METDRWRVPPVLPVLKLGAAAVFVLLAIVAGQDTLGVVLAASAAAVLLVWGLRDLVAGERLAADADGVTVVSGYLGRRRLSWNQVAEVKVDSQTRRRMRTELLEIDTGEALHVFSRWDLGADPHEVAERLRAIRPA